MQHNLALYRKYRPKNFDEVVGQDHIVSVLKKSIETGKISHAYLFVGSRGTGKTSVARIFANEIGVSQNDLYEIDAASNRGIDDMRTLRDGVRVMPFDSKYKIYIIDEVHMLSKDSWGAFLKTLEEPPKHVIFILATTELHKVPETIVSRCQIFNFKKPTDAILKNHLEKLAKDEGFVLEDGISQIISLLGDGSFRDAIGFLEKTLNFAKKKNIKVEDVEEILGIPKSLLVNAFLEAIVEEDLEKGLSSVRKVSEENIDIDLFFKMIILRFRIAIILRYAKNLIEDMAQDLSSGDLEFLNNLIQKDKKGMLRVNNLSHLLEGYSNLSNAFIATLPLEIALVKILKQE